MGDIIRISDLPDYLIYEQGIDVAMCFYTDGEIDYQVFRDYAKVIFSDHSWIEEETFYKWVDDSERREVVIYGDPPSSVEWENAIELYTTKSGRIKARFYHK